jgi:tRNA A37 methylthiotransferase MiaB
MKQLDGGTIKLRSTEASAIVRRIEAEKNSEWLGWKGRVLVTEKGRGGRQWMGRNGSYKAFVMEGGDDLLGKKVEVEAVGASVTHIKASIRQQG